MSLQHYALYCILTNVILMLAGKIYLWLLLKNGINLPNYQDYGYFINKRKAQAPKEMGI